MLALLPPLLAVDSWPGELAASGDLNKSCTLRPKELRITATSGMGSLLKAINVLGTRNSSADSNFPSQGLA